MISAAGFSVKENIHSIKNNLCPAILDQECVIPKRTTPIPLYRIEEKVPWHDSIPKRMKLMDRSAYLSYAALTPHLSEVKEFIDDTLPHRIGLWFGTSRGPVHKQIEAINDHRKGRMKPSLAVDVPIASASGMVAGVLNIEGPTMTISSTCCSGGHALAEACYALKAHRVDYALVIASEAPLHGSVLGQMHIAGMLTKESDDPHRGCIPFESTRSGTCVGEGAAFVLLTRESLAIAKGIPTQGVIRGWDTATDCHSRTLSDPEGISLEASVLRSLAMSGLNRQDIDIINPHGTGTIYNDDVELRMMSRLYSDETNSPTVIPTKHYTGHCLGATSLMEVVVTLGLLEDLSVQRPGYMNKSIIPDALLGTNTSPTHALLMSLGFWGNIFSAVLECPRGNS